MMPGFEKINQEREKAKQEQTEAIRAAITEAVIAATGPLQKEIASLKGELREIKQSAEGQRTAVIDDDTKGEIREMVRQTAEGVNSYKYPVYALFGVSMLLMLAVSWNSYKLNATAENMDWKYDVVTGVLSGDRYYWWDGQNYEASRKAPEAKRLQAAVEQYQKVTEQMKKQGGK